MHCAAGGRSGKKGGFSFIGQEFYKRSGIRTSMQRSSLEITPLCGSKKKTRALATISLRWAAYTTCKRKVRFSTQLRTTVTPTRELGKKGLEGSQDMMI